MANITTTLVGDSIPTIVAAEALGYIKANTVLAQLVNRDYSNEVATYGQTVTIPYGGALSVNDKSANTVVTLQTPNDSVYTLTLNKHKEVSFLIEDTAKAFARPDWFTRYMQDGMMVLAEQIDGDIAALYSGFSQSIDATSGLGEDDFRNGRRLLNAAKAPQSERYAVLNEDADFELLGIERVVNRDYTETLGSKAANSLTGRFMGFDIFMDQKIVTSGGEAKNLLFHRNAIVMASRPLPPAPAGSGVVQKVMDEDGVGIRVTMSYSPNYLGVQLTLDVLYGVAELRDNHGVTLRTTDL
jgi:hypothetical protein